MRGCTSLAASWSTANGSGGRSGAATPAQQLEAARDTFESMGANGFAERARVELLATGAQARKRVDETRHDLTPQESQIARLAAGGADQPRDRRPPLHQRQHRRLPPPQGVPEARHQVAPRARAASCRSTDPASTTRPGDSSDRRVAHSERVATDDPHGVVTLSGDGGVDQLLRRAVARIEALGLDVFAVIDHSGEAAEVGLTMPDTKLVLFGSPQAAAELMLAHPRIALDLPLKLLICEGGRPRALSATPPRATSPIDTA